MAGVLRSKFRDSLKILIGGAKVGACMPGKRIQIHTLLAHERADGD